MSDSSNQQPAAVPEALRLATARAIWAVMREYEDRCDMELEDMGKHCHAWALADAALSAAATAVASRDAAHIHLAWRGALKACGVSGADRDAISEVVLSMLAEDGDQAAPNNAAAPGGEAPSTLTA